jgi:hypothetical protein
VSFYFLIFLRLDFLEYFSVAVGFSRGATLEKEKGP